MRRLSFLTPLLVLILLLVAVPATAAPPSSAALVEVWAGAAPLPTTSVVPTNYVVYEVEGTTPLDVTVPPSTRFDATRSTPGWSCGNYASPGTPCRFNGTSARFAVQVLSPVAAGQETLDFETTSVPLVAAPNLRATLQAGYPYIRLGQTINYMIRPSNAGNQIAHGVLLTASIPANVTVNLGASTPGWTCAAGSCSFYIGQPLVPNVILALTGAARGNGTLSVVIGHATPEESYPPDNTATYLVRVL